MPPLNRFIIGQLLARTRGARHLEEGYPVEELHNLLLRISEMICELPELETMDLNPLVVTEKGLRIQDGVVHIRKTPIDAGRYSHMAIHPYPTDLERMVTLPAGEKIQIRPIRPEDAAREQDFVRGLSSESRYFRFLQAIRELSPEALVRFTQIDYDREMALVALVPDEDGKEKQIGVARYTMAPDDRTCDFAIVIADEWKGRGLGTILMEALMEAARSRGLQEIQGDVLQDNGGMLHLMKKLGFQKKSSREDPSLCLVTRNLQSS